ncbi:10598_t:CDS:2 [Entrophospora sp. SA101]|nr:10598_t:CDS:2 [Entrophospora sp. SA101]
MSPILEFKNLKTLHLENSKVDEIDVPEEIKSASFPNIREVTVKNFDGELLNSMTTFIDINGYGLKSLEIGGAPSDHDDLLLLLSSIGKCCRNLEDLTVFYANHLHYYLNDIFSNCRRLKKIYLRLIGGIVIFVDDIVTALIETQPKNLKSIKFGNNINVTDTALVFLCKKWSGPKPFLLSYSNYKQHSIDAVSPIPVLDRCMIMGFLEYEKGEEGYQ